MCECEAGRLDSGVAPVRHLYFHIPFCTRLCPYCCFYVETSGRNKTTQFIEALLDEVSVQAEAHTIEPRTIYLGGGTPSALGIHQLDLLLRGLHERLDLSQLEEWTVEINPATVSPGKARLLRANGISRVSMGVQAWDDAVLAALGRNHSAEQAGRTFQTLRAAGFDNINIDLMFAVPGQTREQWLATLEKTVSLRPEHVSCYCLTYEEDTEFFRKLTRGEFRQDNDWDADLFELAMDVLGAAGFDHYEISNYAQPGRQSAHNRAYWRGDDYLGFGPSAFSTADEKRWQNVPDTARYIAAISGKQSPALEAEPLDPALRNREAIAFGLRTETGVAASALIAHETEVREFRELGLLENRADRIVLTRRGKLLADAVAQAFV
jgi:oxygen-independent coproporphyrinogen-3 oxidase